MLDQTFNTPAGDGTGRQDEDGSFVAPQHLFRTTIVGPTTLTAPAWFAPASDGTSGGDVGAASKNGGRDDFPDVARDLSKPDASAAVGGLQEWSPSENDDDSGGLIPSVCEAPDDPHRLARDVLLWVPRPEVPGLAHYQNAFYTYNGKCYRPDPEFTTAWLVKRVKASLDTQHRMEMHDQREQARQRAYQGQGTGGVRLKPVAKVTKRMIGDVAKRSGRW